MTEEQLGQLALQIENQSDEAVLVMFRQLVKEHLKMFIMLKETYTYVLFPLSQRQTATYTEIRNARLVQEILSDIRKCA